jgi:hypothetical protein
MENTKSQIKLVYIAKLISSSYISDSYQSEEINLGIFSNESIAIDSAFFALKEGIYELYSFFTDYLLDIKEEMNSLSPKEKLEAKAIEEIVLFLKEQYNYMNEQNIDIHFCNDLIETISLKIQVYKEFNPFKFLRENDNNLFYPFFTIFFDNISENYELSNFFLEIKEVVLDEIKLSDNKNLPQKIK